MPHRPRFIILGFILAMLLGGFFVVRTYLPAVRPAFGPPPEDITTYLPEDSVPPQAPLPAENEINFPLKLPPGFRISIFAKDLPGARVMRPDRFGNLWVSRTSAGAVSLLEIDRDTGRLRHQGDVFTGLRKPHGLAFDPQNGLTLYIAEEHRLRRFATYSEDPGTELLSLPAGDGHFTRTIAFGPDGKLYISVGSSCNVCIESDERRASILRYDPATATAGKPETKQYEIYARGLRNAVFFAWDYVRGPVTKFTPDSKALQSNVAIRGSVASGTDGNFVTGRGHMWATEMGRDWLGDDLPPDEIVLVRQGKDYGWPICYGKNVHDADFDKNTYIRDPCAEQEPSFIDIPAHSAPLGLAFIVCPPEYRAAGRRG